MRFRNILVTLVLVAAAIGSWWLAGDHGTGLPSPSDAGELPPGYYLRDARLLTMNEQGELAYALEADEARQERDGAPVILYRVRVRYTPELDIPWDVAGGEAEVGPQERLIRLSGGVEARTHPDSGRRIVLRTESLTIDPDSHRAWSDQPVNVETDDGTLHSRGFVAFMREDRVQLESEVHGIFKP